MCVCCGCHAAKCGSVRRVSVRVLVCVVTVFEDANEQRLVSLAVPPVSWDFSMKRLRNPDIQHTAKDTHTQCCVIIKLNLLGFIGSKTELRLYLFRTEKTDEQETSDFKD